MSPTADIRRAWHSLTDAFPETLLILTLDGNVRLANPAAVRLFDTDQAKLLGTPLHQLLNEEEEAVRMVLRRWARSGNLTRATLSRTHVDEIHKLWAEGARLVTDSGAEPFLLVRLSDRRESVDSFHQLNRRIADLTEEVLRRKRAESRLDGQREVFEMMARGDPLSRVLSQIVLLAEKYLDGARGSILILDSEQRLRMGAAPRLPEAYNNTIDGVAVGPNVGSCGTAAYLGRPVIVGDIGTDPLWADYREVALSNGLRACWSYPIVTAENKVLGSVAMYYDEPRLPSPNDEEITEMACYVAGIAISRWHTEQALQQRAAQLAEADRSKNEFLAMLAHELRNPLSALVTTLELMRQTSDADQREERMDVLERQSQHLSRIVDDLLNVARISRGKIDLRSEPVNLVRLVQHLHEANKAVAESGAVDFAVEFEPPAVESDGLWVQGDEDRLLQVLGNLLSNALKFTPSGGQVRVKVTADGEDAVVKVVDNGEGIEPDVLNSIFEPFAQGSRSLERRQGGLGIGLTLAKSLVDNHGGSLEALSEGSGQGSEFILRLPLTIERSGSVAKPSPPKNESRPESSLRVLLVEDNADSAKALSALIGIWGHSCRVAADGRTALAVAQEFQPNLVLLDIGLPEMDGYQVARRLRAEERFGHDRCTLIALTGYGQDSDRKAAMEAGFDQHMIKPVNVARLQQTLAELAS